MKELGLKLYGIIVPEDSEDFEIENGDVRNAITERNQDRIYFVSNGKRNFVIVWSGFKIIGTASEKKITFDAGNYVENVEIGYRVFYLMYTNKKVTQYPNKSFMSLVKSKGIELKPNEKLLIIQQK